MATIPHVPTLDLREHVIGRVHRHTLESAVNRDPNGRDMTVHVTIAARCEESARKLEDPIAAVLRLAAAGLSQAARWWRLSGRA